MSTIIKNAGFHHVAIFATDFDKSLDFYTVGLGFKPILAWGTENNRAVMLDIGDGGCIELFAGVKVSKIHDEMAGEWLHFAISTDDAEGAYNAAIEAGAKTQMPPTDLIIPSTPPLPVKIAFVKGPDGEVIEFFQS